MDARVHEAGTEPQEMREGSASICMPLADSGLVQIGKREMDDLCNSPIVREQTEQGKQLSPYPGETNAAASRQSESESPRSANHSDRAPGEADVFPALPLQDISRLFWGWEENIPKNSSTEASPRRFSPSAMEGADNGHEAENVKKSPGGNARDTEQPILLSLKPALHHVPYAGTSPSYSAHLRYELGLTRRFWSFDLHHRDWRQVFVSSYFPNLIDVAALVLIRLVLCVVLLVLEFFASSDVKNDLGWPMLLYFTNWNSYMTSIYFCLLCFLSVRAAWSFRTRTDSPGTDTEETPEKSVLSELVEHADVKANPTSGVDDSREVSAKETVQSQGWAARTSNETPPSAGSKLTKQKSRHLHYNPEKGLWGCFCIRSKHTAPTLPPKSTVRRKLADCLLLPGYHDLMSHEVYCVEGILLAPNPSYPDSLACPCVRRKRACAREKSESEPRVLEHESDSKCSGPRTPLLVSIVWLLHSVHLIASVGVCLIFFLLLNQNGNKFPESWYSVWKHLMIVVVTLMHSLLLSRIPLPIRHVVFAYIFIMVYLAVQVVVFLLDLPNGDGAHGYIYRVFDLRFPGRTLGVAALVLASIAVLALVLWSVSRQRSLLVDPPPCVAVSASTFVEMRAKQLAAKLHEMHLSVDCGVGDCCVDTREASRQTPFADP
ncbi:hypothetical protein TGME49_249660 [Toxoplasma gondii ME49]|uniref:Transmembrane protein n=2 Tax=Toxoplasma gondii TaxID=5811 RepID=S8G9Y2_TOXGM|nr:hypothetical protein TGME49_249660 [Toxoplasma gondii ME49]EPT25119.1 hypothetical protein TGME49_249660 [Toxoplasma gondii ME49]ESS34397.1 putative transmembrane protein [Toxoplasma gondii VEG]CEL78575.1 TPA: hypothetical protein BN1205_002180 [Toxoplasma gondii VEG]|eukprot:XP_002367299.2 hypothetical protein TGME49_249660 [Toxoplasma gondii ME49]